MYKESMYTVVVSVSPVHGNSHDPSQSPEERVKDLLVFQLMQEDNTNISFGEQKEAVELCESLRRNVGQVDSMLDLEVATPDVEECERRQLHLVTRDVIHQYFMFGFEVK